MKAKLHLNLLILCFAVLFYSCSASKSDISEFNLESFSETIHLSNGGAYKNKNLFLGYPTSLKFHPDSFLIIEDFESPRLIKIIDLENNNIQELIAKGKGPGEMIAPWGLDIIGKNIFVFCGQLRKVIILSPGADRKFRISEEFKLDEKEAMRFCPLKDDLFLCLSNIGDEKRLTYLDTKGRIIKKFGDYPPFLNDNEEKGDNDIFNSFIAAKPGGNKFVLACDKTDIIEIYDTKKGLEKRLSGPIGIQLTITPRKVGYGYMRHAEPAYFTFGQVTSTDTGFWVGYYGYKSEKNKVPSDAEKYIKQVFCFDWNGRALRKIDFDIPFLAIDIDWKSNVLYSLIWQNENPEILIYDIDGVL